MASKSTIIAAIEQKVGLVRTSLWRIGLTNDFAKTRAYWRDGQKENLTGWGFWTADSLYDARSIEAHFVKQGMKSGSTGELSPSGETYVYVF